MALTTDRISVLRGRPPVRAGGRRGFRTAHCWLVRSLGYGLGFIPFLRSSPPLLEQTLSGLKSVASAHRWRCFRASGPGSFFSLVHSLCPSNRTLCSRCLRPSSKHSVESL